MKKFTTVQRRVLDALKREPRGSARVGRGLPFKCNRITARALRDLGLVTTDATACGLTSEEIVFTIALTDAGRSA